MTEQTEKNEGISLNDLALIINIIDICTKRGAFEGNELLTVGQVRNKLEAFVKANTPKQEETTEEETTEAAE
jgi:hypothetical protein